MPVATRARRSVGGSDPAVNLPSLPAEILSRIVTHLDKEDAKHLATVCEALQPSAETILWRKIDLSMSIIWEIYDAKEPGDEERVVRPCRKNLWLAQRRDNGIKTRLENIKLAFKHQPGRMNAIRKLTIEPCKSISADLAKLLLDLWLQLYELDVNTREYSCIYDDATMQDHLRTFYRSRQIRTLPQSTRLRSLKINLSDRWEEELLHWLRVAPNMEKLEIKGVEAQDHPLPPPKKSKS